MTTASIIALLQAALMLLTLVQSSPHLPQSMRDTAQAVAQQAISTATKELGNPTSKPAPVVIPQTLSLSVVESEVRNNAINYKLDVPAQYAGHHIVFILNPQSVYPPVGSGSVMTTQVASDWKGGRLTGSLSVQQAHEGFAGNQGGVHWFPTSPGTYILSIAVYPQSPFKPGTEMEYWPVDELYRRGLGSAAVANSGVFRILPQFSESASLTATPYSGTAPLSVYFKGIGSVLTSGAFISFGDGTNGGEGGINVSHTYATPGSYTATLHKDGAKGEVVAQTTVTVSAPQTPAVTNPVVISSFTASPLLVKAGQSVTFSWNSNLTETDISTYSGFCTIEGKPASGNATFTVPLSRMASGSVSYAPSETATYTLFCSSSAKDGMPSAQKTILVPVSGAVSDSCQVIDIYTKSVPGKVYYELFLSVRGLPGGQGAVDITGAGTYDGVPFYSDGFDASGNFVLKGGQTFNGTAANYVLQRKNAIVPVSYGDVPISCSPIGSST